MNVLIIVVILGLAYFFLMLPARRRRTAHADMQDSVGLGDEIITAGGLHGHVKGLDEEANTVQLEISPGVVVTLDRRAVAAVARDVEVEVEPAETPAESAEEPS
ncbi:MAG TPA: preprotein translocase subunit YajC [Gaiellaceae bacterium]|nr:preprotein translocase subunit YajC [Gaiellaceae bacterium]